MNRKTRVDIYLVAEFEHNNPYFSIKNKRDGHAFVGKIKDLFKELLRDRKVKFLLKRDEASFLDDSEEKIPELADLYLENKIINELIKSIEEGTGKIELQVVNTKSRSK